MANWSDKYLLKWVNNPIFSDSGASITKKLQHIVHLNAAGRYNFNDPVRSTRTALVPSGSEYISSIIVNTFSCVNGDILTSAFFFKHNLWNCYSSAFCYSVKYTDFPDCIWDVHDVLCCLTVTENGVNSNVKYS